MSKNGTKRKITHFLKVSVAVNESSDEEDFIESDEEDEEGTTSHGDAEKGQKRYVDLIHQFY